MKIVKLEDEEYPEELRKIINPPKKLYIEGNADLLKNTSLSIVGSRNCSEYGIKYTKKFSREIANKGITIISGLAIGIDAVAHDTAKNCKGKTIAVIGCGLNHIYPEENRELFKEILENEGCIVTEYEPNEPVNMKNFPKRNRIISGLSKGVLIIEAGYRSGTTITGRLGLSQNKKVFCLPRELGNSRGIGNNELIKIGAKLVTTPSDILKEFRINCEEEKPEIIEETHKKIPDEYINIYNFLSYTPQSIQSISKKSEMSIAETTQKLIMLELQGYVKNMPGNYYIRT